MHEQLTDAQLSERVCKALGIEPRREWAVGPDKDSIRITFTSRQAAYNWKVLQPRENNLIVWELEIYRTVLDWPGFGRVVERLRELGIELYDLDDYGKTYRFELYEPATHKRSEGIADTLPRALALAVLEWEASR